MRKDYEIGSCWQIRAVLLNKWYAEDCLVVCEVIWEYNLIALLKFFECI